MERMKQDIKYVSIGMYKQLEEENNRLEEENKNLKSDLAFERTMLDNVRAEYKSLQNVIKNLKARIEIQKLNILFFEKELDLYQKLHEKTLSENKKLKDKIEHLEFDIGAWKKLKTVWEKKEQKLQIEIGGLMGERDGLQMVVERLQDELKDSEHNWDLEKRKADRKAIENTELRKKNKELLLYINDLEDELWVRKHSHRKLMKDKKLYEKARNVMFGPEQEDLYEDIK